VDNRKRFNQALSRRTFLKITGAAMAPLALGLPAGCVSVAPQAGATPGAGAAVGAAQDCKPPVISIADDPETLDPHFGESGPSAAVLRNVLEPLVAFDRQMNIAPLLAESWEQPDDVTWRFKLREGVVFHNGEPFNAEAVKFTIERTMDPDMRAQGVNDPFPGRSGIDHVTVVDPYTVDLVLSAPNILLPVFLTFLYILEPTYYTETSIQETTLRPVGTGAWRVAEWVKGDHLTLQSFPDYWRGDPGLPEIIYRPVPDAATRLNMLLAGEVDMIGRIAPENFPQIEGNENLRVTMVPGTNRIHIGIPTNVPRYQDRAVREALVQAIDYEAIAELVYGPMAPQRRPTVLVSNPNWLNTELPLVQYDPEAARAALEAAGYPFDQSVTIYASAGSFKASELTQAVAGNLRAIGIPADVQVLDFAVYVDMMRSPQGIDDLYLLGLGSRGNGPEDVGIVTTNQIWDQTRWTENTENGPIFNEMYQELVQTFDEAEQQEMVREMQRLHYEEAVWASLWLEPIASGVNRRFTWEDYGNGLNLNFWPPNEDPVRVLC
jgi:peptide/nickel transport system substrate-binding protein